MHPPRSPPNGRADGIGEVASNATPAMPLVDCIVPTFNSARYLREALDSILAQTYRSLEIIVADDSSTDGTVAIAEAYGVRVVTQPTAGPAATRNLGLRATTRDFVAFLDADDVWHPEKLSRQMARFELNPELEVSFTHARVFWETDLAAEAERLRRHRRADSVPAYVTGAMVARRRVFETVGLLDPTLWFVDALEWYERAVQRGVVIELLPETLLNKRLHPSSITRRLEPASRKEFIHLVRTHLRRRPLHGNAPD